MPTGSLNIVPPICRRIQAKVFQGTNSYVFLCIYQHFSEAYRIQPPEIEWKTPISESRTLVLTCISNALEHRDLGCKEDSRGRQTFTFMPVLYVKRLVMSGVVVTFIFSSVRANFPYSVVPLLSGRQCLPCVRSTKVEFGVTRPK